MAQKKSSIQKPMTKSQIVGEIADGTGLTRRDVSNVLEELSGVMHRHIRKRGAGTFTLPGLLKVKVVKVPARKARKGVPNPFRPGETMDVAARPATVKVKIQPLKKLKEMAKS